MLFLRYYLLIAPHVLLAVFLVIFLAKGLLRQLPSVAVYAGIELARFLVGLTCRLFLTPFPQSAYRWLVLVFGGALLGAAELWIIYELFNKLVLSHSPFARVGRMLLSGALAILLLGAAASSGALSKIGVDQALNVFETLDFSSSLIRVGLILLVVICSRALRISWRNWIVGIALGLGVSSCVDLATAAWRAALPDRALIPVDIAQGAAFHICIVIWFVYLFVPNRKSQFTEGGLEKADLESWEAQLRNMIH